MYKEVICTQVSRQASQGLPLPPGTSAHESQFLMQLSHGYLEDLWPRAEQKETQSPSAYGRVAASRLMTQVSALTRPASCLHREAECRDTAGPALGANTGARGDAAAMPVAVGGPQAWQGVQLWQEVWVSALPLLAQVPGLWPGLAPH